MTASRRETVSSNSLSDSLLKFSFCFVFYREGTALLSAWRANQLCWSSLIRCQSPYRFVCRQKRNGKKRRCSVVRLGYFRSKQQGPSTVGQLGRITQFRFRNKERGGIHEVFCKASSVLRKTIFYFSTPYSLISFSGRQRVDNSFTVCACIEMYFHLVWEGGEEDNNNRKK